MRLPVSIWDGLEMVTMMVEFIVVDRPSVYNVILGRPTLNVLKVVVSTYHLAMKCPMESGSISFGETRRGLGSVIWRLLTEYVGRAPPQQL